MQFVEFGHGQFGRPFLQLLFVQCGVETHSGFDVVRKGGAEIAWPVLGVADFPAGVGVIDPPAGVSISVGKGEKYFAELIKISAIEPGLVHVRLRPGASG